MEQRIVVIGGSFNPPTVAHLRLMNEAMAAIDARLGIFLPTGHEYVARKMKRMKCPQDTLSEAVRFEMLQSMCLSNDRFTVSPIRFSQTELQYDYETLLALQAQYPDDELYFVTGSDKLYVLPRWHQVEALVNDFRILIARRGDDELERIKEIRPFIQQHWDRFAEFPIPDDILQISSSAFREKLHNNDPTACELVTPEVWKLLNQNGKIPWNAITDFHASGYEYLSNFYEADVCYEGLTFGSNEAAFQAQKCLSAEAKQLFTGYSPGKSKGIGRRVQLRSDWEQVKVGIMEEIVRAKFRQHPELAAMLLNTGEKVLIEGNRWGDTFWGVDTRTGQGENHLGIILMKVRQELQNDKNSMEPNDTQA